MNDSAIIIKMAYRQRDLRIARNPQARDCTPRYKTHLNGRLSWMLFCKWWEALHNAYEKNEILPLPAEYPTLDALADLMTSASFGAMVEKDRDNWDSDPWVMNELRRSRAGNRF